MIPRIRTAADFFLAAVDPEKGKIAGFVNVIATDEERFRDLGMSASVWGGEKWHEMDRNFSG